uniref:E3 ubiquitin-protein ligase PPP1R11 n=1 Tax=Timema genevievae TaxID=629358 RepID=A0A7R9JXP0_TIMGE|nr:unnamed protein product [Timema genevievae]
MFSKGIDGSQTYRNAVELSDITCTLHSVVDICEADAELPKDTFVVLNISVSEVDVELPKDIFVVLNISVSEVDVELPKDTFVVLNISVSESCGVVSAFGYELRGPGFGLRLVPWQDVHTVRLKLRKPKPVKKVQWRSGTVDNEHMNRRKSKCCCVYEKPRVFGESSSESEDEECENCHGHVEHRSNSQTPPEDTASGSADNGSAADLT